MDLLLQALEIVRVDQPPPSQPGAQRRVAGAAAIPERRCPSAMRSVRRGRDRRRTPKSGPPRTWPPPHQRHRPGYRPVEPRSALPGLCGAGRRPRTRPDPCSPRTAARDRCVRRSYSYLVAHPPAAKKEPLSLVPPPGLLATRRVAGAHPPGCATDPHRRESKRLRPLIRVDSRDQRHRLGQPAGDDPPFATRRAS